MEICRILNFYQVFERIRLGNSGSYENSTEKEGTTFLQHSEAKKRGLLRKLEPNNSIRIILVYVMRGRMAEWYKCAMPYLLFF